MMKYIVKKTKIYAVDDDYNTKKKKYNTYNEALGKVAKKKISTVTNRLNHEIIPQLVETYRFIYSLPKEERIIYSKMLEEHIGSLAYKRKAQKLGKIKLITEEV